MMGMMESMHHALHRGRPGSDVISRLRFDVEVDLHLDENAGRIRCPFCEWTPQRNTRWYCASCPEPEGFLGGCGTAWNTFDTHGLCPGCQHQWRWTSCQACGLWSLHDDWYEQDEQPS
jgi:hypothetical protein